MEVLKSLGSLNTEYEAARKAMVERGTALLKEALTDVFAAHPELEAVRWEQYTRRRPL